MSLIRWEPFEGLMTLRDAMDRLFEESFVRPFGGTLFRQDASILPIDMYETENEVVVKASVPGIKPEELDIQVRGDTLTIRGETKSEEEKLQGTWHYKERRYGTFCRSMSLPSGVNADAAQATFENGVLTLTLPKIEEAKPKIIRVKSK